MTTKLKRKARARISRALPPQRRYTPPPAREWHGPPVKPITRANVETLPRGTTQPASMTARERLLIAAWDGQSREYALEGYARAESRGGTPREPTAPRGLTHFRELTRYESGPVEITPRTRRVVNHQRVQPNSRAGERLDKQQTDANWRAGWTVKTEAAAFKRSLED